MKKLFYLLMAATLLSCNNGKEEKKTSRLTFTNNCESLRGFQDNPPGFSMDYANSGNYSNLTDSTVQFGVTFREKYGKLTLKTLTKVKLSGYGFYINPNAQCDFCISIDLDGKNLFWNGITCRNFVKDAKVWTKFEAEFTLPQKIEPNSVISVFPWNKGKYPFYIDDIEIQFFD